MTLYQWLLYLHILSGGTWLGAGVMIVLLGVRAHREGRDLELISQMEWVGRRVGGPAVVVTLVTGLWMVLGFGVWTLSQLWVLGGLILLALLFFAGVGFHVPQYKRIHKAEADHGKGSPEVQRLVMQSYTVARLEVVLLAFAIFLMVFKPGI